MKYLSALSIVVALGFGALASSATASPEAEDSASLEQRFQSLPLESRRLIGPLFWLHGDDTKEALELEIDKVAEGGNGCVTPEARPHPDWLGPGWWRDWDICLNRAKKYDLQMWIFDEKWWPSQSLGGKVPARYAAKSLAAAAVEVQGPREYAADGYRGECYVAAVAGRVASDGNIDGASLLDLASFIHDGKLAWNAPEGKWKVMKFTHVQAPRLDQGGMLSVDGASKDCVDWFINYAYQPYYDRYKADFGKTIRGYFYDEPEVRGDWGTELNATLAEWKVDWKKAYVANKFELSGEEQTAARFQYMDAFVETWGRTMYGGTTRWCEERGVKSIGHFMEHSGFYYHRAFCGGDMMRLQKYSSMGGIDAVNAQFVWGRRETENCPIWQTPKLASSVSHVFGKQDDIAMIEILGCRGQNFTYPEMKWWADHMQVSGINFMVTHAFNPRAPYDTEGPGYFYNGGYEPRWPMYRVLANYLSRLSLMLTGGRHVCPIAVLWSGNLIHNGKAIGPEVISDAIQDSQYDHDRLPMEVFESGNTTLKDREIALYGERYRVLVVPPVELIPYGTLVKAKEFYERGGVVVGYGFLPSKSATIGKTSKDIAALRTAIWGDAVKPGVKACNTNAAGGRAYFISENPTSKELAAALTDAGVHPTLEVLEGDTGGWLHVLHRNDKDGRDVFLVVNQNHQGAARKFKFRATAQGEPEWWDAMRNEITSFPFTRVDANTTEFALTLEPNETALLVFQPKAIARPRRIDSSVKPVREPIVLTREPSQPPKPLLPEPKPGRPISYSPVKAADPFRSRFTLLASVDLAKTRVFLEMDELYDDSAVVTVNDERVGGMISKPLRLDITRQVKPGENTLVIEPLAPKAARLVFYDAAQNK